jgi:hypothetical protein
VSAPVGAAPATLFVKARKRKAMGRNLNKK